MTEDGKADEEVMLEAWPTKTTQPAEVSGRGAAPLALLPDALKRGGKA
jgi:hypothetical protein